MKNVLSNIIIVQFLRYPYLAKPETKISVHVQVMEIKPVTDMVLLTSCAKKSLQKERMTPNRKKCNKCAS